MRLRGLEAEGTAATPQHGARSGEYTAGVLPHSHLSHGHDVSAGNRKSALQTLTDASRNVEMRAQRSALPGMFLWEACSTRLEKKLQCTVKTVGAQAAACSSHSTSPHVAGAVSHFNDSGSRNRSSSSSWMTKSVPEVLGLPCAAVTLHTKRMRAPVEPTDRCFHGSSSSER